MTYPRLTALTARQEGNASPGSWNCLQFLQELAQEQNFKLTWLDIDEKTFDGKAQAGYVADRCPSSLVIYLFLLYVMLTFSGQSIIRSLEH